VLRANSPPDALAALQREYERIAREPGLDAGLQQARAQWLYSTQPGVFSDPPSGFEAQRMTPFQAIGMRLLRPARDHAAIVQLRQFDEAISAAKQPWPRPLDEAARLDKTFPRTSNRGSLTSTVVGGVIRNVANSQLQFYANSVAETVARTNASIAALAIARWRADHGGAVPTSLRDLMRRYVSVPLLDPYSGGELKYIADAQGYRVYSVGSNRQDDGGVWEQRSDLLVSRRGDPLDVGIAVRESPKSP
jgi:hypothetical protein